MSLINLTPAQLRLAADLKDQIANLETKLAAVFGGKETPAPVAVAKPVVAKKRGMSAAGKARVAAAQKARWAKIKAAKAVVAAKPVVKTVAVAKPAAKKGKISPEGLARIIAAQKARWAKVKTAKVSKK